MKQVRIEKIASRGITSGHAYILSKPNLDPSPVMVTDEQKSDEIARIEEAFVVVAHDTARLAEESEVFAGLHEVTKNLELKNGTLHRIINENKNAELALEVTCHAICAKLDAEEDLCSDLKDICKRLMAFMKGVSLDAYTSMDSDTIIIARELTTSNLTDLDMSYVRGIITQLGGVTSHLSIFAKDKGIPSAVGMTDVFSLMQHDDEIILDCVDGFLIVNPDEPMKKTYERKIVEYSRIREEYKHMANFPAKTKDGREISVYANVGSVSDTETAMENGADGIGLFRSELVYLDSFFDFPPEDEQLEVYEKTAELADNTVIRTLDIGGDKPLPYYSFEEEMNPFLGWRSIRVSMDMPDVFKTQLRAILRAGDKGNLAIIFPMIISLDEFRRAKAAVDECKAELEAEGLAYDKDMKVGVMIETPASVIMARELAEEADFFSIGTNDLTQYLLCADRANERLADLYDPFCPAVMRAVKQIIDAANEAGIPVGMSGELAGDPNALPVLIGMGLTEFSLTSSDIAELKYRISTINYEEAKLIAQEVLAAKTRNEVREITHGRTG